MKQRIITGLIGGIGFLYFVWLGGLPYFLLISLLAWIGYIEILKMNHIHPVSSEGIIGLGTVLFILLIPLQSIFPFFKLEIESVILASLILFLTLIVIKKNKINFDEVASLFLGAFYVGFGFAFMFATRLTDGGFALTLLVLSATWASDSGAYFSGKYLGKKKLWPEISPNKTIEGSFGGILFAVLISLILNYFFSIEENLLQLILIGVLISVIGQIGDLVESALKRTKNIKDSGSLIPGHGGVLDRFDSLIFVFPILYLLHIL